MITPDGRYIDTGEHRIILPALLVVLAVCAAFAAGYHLRGPVESRQAAVRLDECRADIERAQDDVTLAYFVARGTVNEANRVTGKILDMTVGTGWRANTATWRGE